MYPKVRMIDDLRTGIQNQDERIIAKAISILENNIPNLSQSLRKEIYTTSSKTYVLGITGAPGAGKSTLIEALVSSWDSQLKIGIVSIDPSNKMNGGALLGDRIRMAPLFSKPNVFIRSMSNRGIFGGVNKSIYDVIQLFSFASYDIVIVETIGVGQNEIDIADIADTVMVISAPESGDSIQILKAGLMEIADMYVINKIDLAGAERMEYMLRENMKMQAEGNWSPKIVKIQANQRKHMDVLLQTIQEHKAYLTLHNQLYTRRKNHLKKTIREAIIDRFTSRFIDPILQEVSFENHLHNIIQGTSSFDEAIDHVLLSIEKDVKK